MWRWIEGEDANFKYGNAIKFVYKVTGTFQVLGWLYWTVQIF